MTALAVAHSDPPEVVLTPRTTEDPVALTALREISADVLVGYAAAGDRDAIAELYRRYSPSVRAVCGRRLVGNEAVDDAVQETFLRAQEALPRFRGGAEVERWLKRIARNYCSDVRKRRTALPLTDEHSLTLVDRGAERALDGVEQRETMWSVLRHLSPRDARLLVAHHVDGRPLVELANEVDLTPASLAVTLSRARTRVRACTGALGIAVVAVIGWVRRLIQELRQTPVIEQTGQLLISVTTAGALMAILAGGPLAVPGRSPVSVELARGATVAEGAARAVGGAAGFDDRAPLTPVQSAVADLLVPSAAPVAAPAPVAPVVQLDVDVPMTDHGVTTAPMNPDPDYEYAVVLPVVDVPVGSASSGEPALAPVDALACDAASLLPGGYCEAPGS